MTSKGRVSSPEYDQGYRDGESSTQFDWEFALTEWCDLPDDVEPLAACPKHRDPQAPLDGLHSVGLDVGCPYCLAYLAQSAPARTPSQNTASQPPEEGSA